MKTKFNLLIAIVCFSIPALSSAQQAGVVKAHIKVYGNCTMCKKRIETALDHKGIKQAVWDVRTKDLTVVYNPSSITEERIHKLLATAGHDTDKVKATDEVYAALPYCCLYRDHDEPAGDKVNHQP